LITQILLEIQRPNSNRELGLKIYVMFDGSKFEDNSSIIPSSIQPSTNTPKGYQQIANGDIRQGQTSYIKHIKHLTHKHDKHRPNTYDV
jgi:hypothetical protein